MYKCRNCDYETENARQAMWHAADNDHETYNNQTEAE